MKNILAIFIILVSISAANAQTTTFTYQGKLSDNSLPATGNYELQFKIYDTANVGTGNHIGGLTQTVNATVTNGIFTVQLDFGSDTFSGDTRFIEISVRRNSGESFVTLAPRQPLTSSPYSIRSKNAETAITAQDAGKLGGIPANDYVQTTDPRMTDERSPLAGSQNYIQNGTTAQSSSNFNISGEGKAGIFSAATQFNIGNNRVLSTPGTNNIFVGVGAGQLNTTGTNNSFFGRAAGLNNGDGNNNAFFGFNAGFSNTANSNSFFGANAGQQNMTGGRNSFFGTSAGSANRTGINNAYFGASAGLNGTAANFNAFFGVEAGLNNNGNFNSFFGNAAGQQNTTGINNAFFGAVAGLNNITGNDNAFFGANAGFSNTGNSNSFFGSNAGKQNTDGVNNAFFGVNAGFKNAANSNSFFGAFAGQENLSGINNSYFGSTAGRSGTTANYNAFFGMEAGIFNNGDFNSFFGNASGQQNTTGAGNSYFGASAGLNNTEGQANTFVGSNVGFANTTGSNNTLLGSNTNTGANNLTNATAIGSGAVVSQSNTIALGRANGADKVQIFGLGAAGSTQLCRNASNEISTCSSSRRYKNNIANFNQGLSVINRLRPVTFNWNADNKPDLGLVAEEVGEVDENLIIRNEKGEVEGVKYDRVGVVLVNAVKEQQTQIETQKEKIETQEKQLEMQQKQLDEQKKEIELLKQLVCSQNKSVPACQKEEKDENR